jgi:hypothetical protein
MLARRHRLVRLKRIVDDDEIRSSVRQDTADRCREAKAVGGGSELLNGLLPACKRSLWTVCDKMARS